MSFHPGSIGFSSTEQAGTPAHVLEGESSILDSAKATPQCRFGYFFFLATTAVLFNPPGEIIPYIKEWPLFQVFVLTALIASYPVVVAQITRARLASFPAMLCVMGMTVAIFMSGVANRNIYGGREGAVDFLKVLVYFILLLGLVNTEARLRGFLKFTVFMIGLMVIQAILGYYGLVHLTTATVIQRGDGGHDQTGASIVFRQLQAAGIFSDPNDFALVLVMALLGAIYFFVEAKSFFLRFLWIFPGALIAVGFALTRSRGGLLSLLAGISVWLVSRFGWKRAMALLLLVMPLIFVAFAGRQTDINLDADDTAQSRIRLWRDGIGFIKSAPLFGIGYHTYDDRAGNAAHNSYLHCYAELGFFGGTLFLGCFLLPLTAIASSVTQRRMRMLGAFVLPPVVLGPEDHGGRTRHDERAFENEAELVIKHEEIPVAGNEESPTVEYPETLLPEDSAEYVHRRDDIHLSDSEPTIALPVSLDHLRSTLLAIGIAYGVGLFSLSRAYACSTYLMFGMLCAMQMLIAAVNPRAVPRLSNRLVGILVFVSALWLAFLYVFVRLAVKAAGGH